jgi:hypothetical protein
MQSVKFELFKKNLLLAIAGQSKLRRCYEWLAFRFETPCTDAINQGRQERPAPNVGILGCLWTAVNIIFAVGGAADEMRPPGAFRPL